MTEPLELAPPEVTVERLEGGALLLRSPRALEPYPRCVGERLEHWARVAPERVFLGEKILGDGATTGAPRWRTLTYGEAAERARSIAAGLLRRGLQRSGGVMILSDNSVDHAVLALAAMHVGIPVAPISPAYSLMPGTLARLRGIASQVRPGLVFADDPRAFARALAAVQEVCPEAQVIHELDGLREPAGEAVARAHAAVGPDTIAKILFTSGSTGAPKGVLNTQRMLCSNQQAIAQVWPFLRARRPVLVDWLPWNHTFGGNHNFNMVLFHGGALYIDDGKPAPALIERTLASLRAHAPTLYFNVPRGFDMLAHHLERDVELRDRFFARLDLLFYAGAALPQSVWTRLERVALAARGERVFMSSAWGATETAPLVTSLHFPVAHAGVIGLPAPGCELYLVPRAGKLEMRVGGPGVTPGYLGLPEATAAAFDERGAYITGDAGKLADPEDPRRGVVFDGRIAEDFKLTSGTWVNAGKLRLAVIAASGGVAQDAVVVGEGRDAVGLLVFPGLAACQALVADAGGGEGEDENENEDEAAALELEQLVARAPVRDALRRGLATYNAENPASSRRVARVLLLTEPPRIDAGEITDKGYINQRAVIERRRALVERLYQEPAPDDVLVLDP
ncbi:MAG: feruloyl-CoA synthase [Myxococcales bacterium]|nr:feruloyl-CoA synthase [Myxococcales bacterium]